MKLHYSSSTSCRPIHETILWY